MGYTTDFAGCFTVSRPLTETEKNYINGMSNTRRMKRDVNILMEMYKGKYGNPFATGNTPEEIYGVDGEFYVNTDEPDEQDVFSQGNDKSIIDYNTAPGLPTYEEMKNVPWQERYAIQQSLIGDGKCVPGLWCQWTIQDGGDHGEEDGVDVLAWDGGEKFYEYIAWLKYYINKFFEPWGIKLNGEVDWEGEDSEDFGKIVVVDNVVKVLEGKKRYG
jgi:hypothetical protein